MGADAPRTMDEAHRHLILVAGEESVGRHIRLRRLISQEYVSGRLTQFRKETGEHEFTAHDGRREWVSLVNRTYQWMSPVSADARPNPTFTHFPGVHEAIGWKVRIYWNEMGKFYTGRIKAYDQVAGLHKVVFFDGDVRWYTLRDEAVQWIQKPDGGKKGPNGMTAPEGSEADVQRMRQPRTNGRMSHRKTSTATSTSTSSMESLQSGGRGMQQSTAAQRSQLPGGMILRPRRTSSFGHLTDKNPSFCILHSRIGIFWASDNKYYRGTVQGFIEESGKYRVLYDDNQEEETDLEKEAFRWLGPKAAAAGYHFRMREMMAILGAENVATEKSAAFISATSAQDLASLARPKEAIGRRLYLWWEATGTKYEAEVLAYDHRRKLHYLWYRDGELEWVDLKRERFAWCPQNRTLKEFPAGLDEGQTSTSRQQATGDCVQARGFPEGRRQWDGELLSIGKRMYSSTTVEYQVRRHLSHHDCMLARVVEFSLETGRHDVDYDDGQMETLLLSSEKIIWKSSPTTGSPRSIRSSPSSELQRTSPSQKKTSSSVNSPKHKRPRLPSPPSTDLAKENNVELLEASSHDETTGRDDAASPSERFFSEPPLKRSFPESQRPPLEEEEEELEILPVMHIPPEPLPSLSHIRLAKLPSQFGASVFQVKLLASCPEEATMREACSVEKVLTHVHQCQGASSKIGRLPSAMELSASPALLPEGPVTSHYPTLEMTGMETVTSRLGMPTYRRTPNVRGRGRKKGRPVGVRKTEMGGTPASLGSVLASFPSVSMGDVRQGLPSVVVPQSMVRPLDYSQNLFDAARRGKLPPLVDFSPDALCLLKDNIGTDASGAQKRDPSSGADPV